LFFHNSDVTFGLSREVLDRSPSDDELDKLAGYLQFANHELLFMELGVKDVMKTPAENDDRKLKEHCYKLLINWKRTFGDMLSTVRMLICAMNNCGMENVLRRNIFS